MREEHVEHHQTEGDMVQQHWEQQMPRVRAMLDGGVSAFVQELPNVKGAFVLRDRNIRCIDEGTPGGIHLAGSGILLDPERALEIVKEAAADGIWSHADCGAARLAAARHDVDVSQADDFGQQWAKDLAVAAGVPYRGHIAQENLERPSEHIARIAYYDGTGRFDPSRVPGLPPGFVITRRFLDGAYAAEEAKVGAGIAMGDDGFGDRITTENPFIFVVVGDPKDPSFSLDVLRGELDEIAKTYGGRIRVDGFVAPTLS